MRSWVLLSAAVPRLRLVLAGALALGLAGLGPAQGSNTGQPASTAKGAAKGAAAKPVKPDLASVVGIVDAQRALDSFPKARQLLESLKSRRAAVEGQMRMQEESLQRLKIERDGYDLLTSEWIKGNSTLEAARVALETRLKAEQQRFGIERNKIHAECDKDLNRAVAELAGKKGLLLVIRSWPLTSETSVEETLTRSSYADVIYHDAKLDLTEDVIKLLQSPAYSGTGPSAPANGK